MELRFFMDPETQQPHIYEHGVTEEEVGEVLQKPGEDRPGSEGSRVAIGQTVGGKYLRVIYSRDPGADSVFVNHGLCPERKSVNCPPAAKETERKMKKSDKRAMPKKKQQFPAGWDEERVRRVLDHYENQTDEEAVAEDEAAFEAEGQTVMVVPTELVADIRQLIARRRGA